MSISAAAFVSNLWIGTTSPHARGHIQDSLYATAFKASALKPTGGLTGGAFDAYNVDA